MQNSSIFWTNTPPPPHALMFMRLTFFGFTSSFGASSAHRSANIYLPRNSSSVPWTNAPHAPIFMSLMFSGLSSSFGASSAHFWPTAQTFTYLEIHPQYHERMPHTPQCSWDWCSLDSVPPLEHRLLFLTHYVNIYLPRNSSSVPWTNAPHAPMFISLMFSGLSSSFGASSAYFWPTVQTFTYLEIHPQYHERMPHTPQCSWGRYSLDSVPPLGRRLPTSDPQCEHLLTQKFILSTMNERPTRPNVHEADVLWTKFLLWCVVCPFLTRWPLSWLEVLPCSLMCTRFPLKFIRNDSKDLKLHKKSHILFNLMQPVCYM